MLSFSGGIHHVLGLSYHVYEEKFFVKNLSGGVGFELHVYKEKSFVKKISVGALIGPTPRYSGVFDEHYNVIAVSNSKNLIFCNG